MAVTDDNDSYYISEMLYAKIAVKILSQPFSGVFFNLSYYLWLNERKLSKTV